MAELIKVDEAIFTEVKKALTRPKSQYLQWLIEQFMCSEEKIAEFKWDKGAYIGNGSAWSSLYRAVKVSGYKIKVRQHKGHIYLVKESALDE